MCDPCVGLQGYPVTCKSWDTGHLKASSSDGRLKEGRVQDAGMLASAIGHDFCRARMHWKLPTLVFFCKMQRILLFRRDSCLSYDSSCNLDSCSYSLA